MNSTPNGLPDYGDQMMGAAQSLKNAYEAERATEGPQWTMIYWLACAVVRALCAIATAIKDAK